MGREQGDRVRAVRHRDGAQLGVYDCRQYGVADDYVSRAFLFPLSIPPSFFFSELPPLCVRVDRTLMSK